MGKKKNDANTKDEEVKNVTPSTGEPTTPADDAPAAPAENEPADDKEPAPINADEMAREVKASTGNDYQQYARNMFKERLEESR